ncbi:helix-turn-helix domain-containing protein [Marinitoga lauensis]|uniref:helix-turn-helix domain-containing protein n=1 Tax=Marinitoga lauensis TaxID=2201189 RepID=UPI0010118A65|nr:helix-turn-helix domain-containing protein [Marinitoga lauensis]
MLYDWPGNIREIRNFVERLFIIYDTQKEIKKSDIEILLKNVENHRSDNDFIPTMTLEEMERELIFKTLEKYSGNKTKTAKALGIGLRTLQYKLKKYKSLRGNYEKSNNKKAYYFSDNYFNYKYIIRG